MSVFFSIAMATITQTNTPSFPQVPFPTSRNQQAFLGKESRVPNSHLSSQCLGHSSGGGRKAASSRRGSLPPAGLCVSSVVTAMGILSLHCFFLYTSMDVRFSMDKHRCPISSMVDGPQRVDTYLSLALSREEQTQDAESKPDSSGRHRECTENRDQP